MRLLLVNSNTTVAVTDTITAEARRWAAAGTEIRGINATFGAAIVSTRSEAAISAHALLDVCAGEAAATDAVIVGMSLDAGVWAAREMMEVPVVGMSEAALHMASLHGNRLGLFVFGGITQPYREMAEAYGYGGRIGTVEALGVTPQQHLADPGLVEARIVERVGALAEGGIIDSAILVGAVAAGLPARLQSRLPVPAFEGISCAVLLAESLVRLGAAKARLGSFVPPSGRSTKGLGDDLTAFLTRRRSPG